MARAPAVQGSRSHALAAAPREPGPAEMLDSGVPPGPGCGGHFARAGPSWGGEGQATEQAWVAPGEPSPASCGLPNRPLVFRPADYDFRVSTRPYCILS
jgi:hypothetical protein